MLAIRNKMFREITTIIPLPNICVEIKINYLMHLLCCIFIHLIVVVVLIILDRCVAANCHEHATCNKETSYGCVCKYGYEGSGSECYGGW